MELQKAEKAKLLLNKITELRHALTLLNKSKSSHFRVVEHYGKEPDTATIAEEHTEVFKVTLTSLILKYENEIEAL